MGLSGVNPDPLTAEVEHRPSVKVNDLEEIADLGEDAAETVLPSGETIRLVFANVHAIAFLVFWSVLDLFTLRIIHDKFDFVNPKFRC